MAQTRIETNSSTPYLDLSDFEKLRLATDNANKDYNAKIINWKKKKGLKNDLDAKINYYLMQNLILLQPNEKKNFIVPLNFRNITNKNDTIHDSYILEKNKDYILFLSLDVKKDIYDYLTLFQKRKLQKYKLFTGSLESNKIELR